MGYRLQIHTNFNCIPKERGSVEKRISSQVPEFPVLSAEITAMKISTPGDKEKKTTTSNG